MLFGLCFSVDIRIYNACAFLIVVFRPGFFVIFILMDAFMVLVFSVNCFCQVIVSWMLILIMYSAASS